MAGLYTDKRVVLVETGDPKDTEEVTGLGTVALPCQQEFMTFLGNLRPEKAHLYLHERASTIVLPTYVWNVDLHLYTDGTAASEHAHVRTPISFFLLCITDQHYLLQHGQKISYSTRRTNQTTLSSRLHLPPTQAPRQPSFPCTCTPRTQVLSSTSWASTSSPRSTNGRT